MQKIYPCLWFNGDAEEAMNFYVALFQDSRIVSTMPSPDGGFLFGTFEIQGQRISVLNGGPTFKLSEAASILVECDTQAEVDTLWDKLTADGGSPSKCGWLKDKYGLSWQITPKILLEHMHDPDPVKRNRVMQAMIQMSKIDIATIEAAYAG